MVTGDDLRRLEEIEEWFRRRGYVLRYDVDDEGLGFVAVVMRADVRIGDAIASGSSESQLEAAEKARKDFLAAFGEVVHKHGFDEGRGTDSAEVHVVTGTGAMALGASGVSSPERESLEKIATEFGWYFGFALEPNGGVHWFVFSEDDELLQQGQADDWEGALLEAITDLTPPSGEK